MLLDAGVITISAPDGLASTPGGMPVDTYAEYYQGYYAERTVGVNRYWTAKSNQDQIDQLVRIHRLGSVRTNDLVRLAPFYDTAEAGAYKVLQVQHVEDEDGLPATDLSLERVNFDETTSN